MVPSKRKLLKGRYWNNNGKGIAIIASIREGINWSAYIGADNGQSESACLEWAKGHGDKLSESDARHFFPNIELPYRR